MVNSNRLSSILILNYNGFYLLKQNLPSVIKAINYTGIPHELVVIDNGSTDKSTDFLKREYPFIRIIELNSNEGFGPAYNFAIPKSKNEIVVLLNNDISVKEDFLQPLLDHFSDNSVFGVSSKSYLSDGKTVDAERTCGRFKFGKFQVGTSHSEITCNELYVHGGCCAIDKKKFLLLGGFDNIYYPAYYEDTDLGYRAWKRGWKVIYEPKSVVYHMHMATSKHLLKNKIGTLMTRNNFIFTWKNITGYKLFFFHLVFLPLWLVKNLLFGNLEAIKGFTLATKKIRQIIIRRKREKLDQKITDCEVFNLVATPPLKKPIFWKRHY